MLILIADCFGKIIEFPLTENLTEIKAGSLPENQLYLPYKGVSRHHFTLVRKENQWLLKDSGSTNGTRLNGLSVVESEIKAGDLVQAGIVELRVSKSDQNELVQLLESKASPKETVRTDKIASIEEAQNQNIFASSRLIVPEGMILGKSPQMAQIFQKIHSILDSDISVLLIGETGTGKELFAKMIQLSGNRSRGPFVAVNCAAIPADLMEAELFGIGERVATAVSQRTGKIPLADKGTLFLDELSAFPIELQAKILRAIEEKAVTPVGKHVPAKVDFRLICATNEDPQELIRSGKLREDLYHRVASLEIMIPPLRERKEDLGLMIIGLLQQICKREKKQIAGISKKLLSILTSYSYPGNVRELINLLNAMVAMAHPGEMLDLHLAPGKLAQEPSQYDVVQPDVLSHSEDSIDLQDKLDETSKLWILRALNRHGGNLSATAKSLRISRFGLRKMMKRLNIHSKK
ncbi:sigma 54-interacting transcriptional regulator [bacterium]|nr:sigma 54-interacting transcriptional regulator [bacterium]MCI0605378.1 sigma 54-interacting transcriptional regulator [bacterium]